MAIFAVLLIAFTATTADVKRGFWLPIVVPGLGRGSESIEKVLDLPDIPALKRSDGKYIDLGYIHKRGGKGGWVGYVGSSSTYLPLSESKLKMLLMIAGVPELPPVPQRKGFSGAGIARQQASQRIALSGMRKHRMGGLQPAAAGGFGRRGRRADSQQHRNKIRLKKRIQE